MKGASVIPVFCVVAVVFLGICCGVSKEDHKKTVAELKKALSENKKAVAEYDKIVAEHNRTVAEYDKTMARFKAFATQKGAKTSSEERSPLRGRNSARGEGGRPDLEPVKSASPNPRLLREIETLRAELSELKKKLAEAQASARPAGKP